jgi:hypothetical protein
VTYLLGILGELLSTTDMWSIIFNIDSKMIYKLLLK